VNAPPAPAQQAAQAGQAALGKADLREQLNVSNFAIQGRNNDFILNQVMENKVAATTDSALPEVF